MQLEQSTKPYHGHTPWFIAASTKVIWYPKIVVVCCTNRLQAASRN